MQYEVIYKYVIFQNIYFEKFKSSLSLRFVIFDCQSGFSMSPT